MIKGEKKDFSWENAKKMMAKVDAFKEKLEKYKGEDIPEEVIGKVLPMLDDPEFTFEKMKTKSAAAANLANWVINIIQYNGIYKRVKPLMESLDGATKVTYILIYIYILIYTYTYSYTHIHTHIHIYILIYTYTYSYTHIHTHIHIYILIYSYTYSYTYIHTHILICILIYILIYDMHTHIHIHTHILICILIYILIYIHTYIRRPSARQRRISMWCR
jgi:hypothetical protein